MRNLIHYECTRCGEKLDPSRLQTVCPSDGGVLLARYNLASVRELRPASLADRANTIWRYAELLPAHASPVTLGEGWTPLLKSRTNPGLWIKNEGANPTGSFEDRGLSVAVSALREFEFKKVAISSTGDSATALAAYCAAAGLKTSCFLPREAAVANRVACAQYGAEVILVDGTLEDCERAMRGATANHQDCFAIADSREPHRLEGEKTLAYELVEQLGWRAPDAIIVATGTGSLVVAIWKAIQEMAALGWIDAKRSRLIAVQAAGCAPIVRAFAENVADCERWSNPQTIASELCVRSPHAGSPALKAVRESHGLAVAVTDDEMLAGCSQVARNEGVFAAAEGGAALAAYSKLRATGLLRESDEVVIVNIRTGLKCPEVFDATASRTRKPLPKSHSLGGIIQPY
jgi:threonine synthase